jgi:hypothetical protein
LDPTVQNIVGGLGAVVGTVWVQFLVQRVLLRLALHRRLASLHGRTGFRALRAQSRRVVFTVLMLLLGHIMQVAVWSGLYVWLGEFAHAGDAIYFSMASFVTVGASDLELSRGHRVLGAVEAGMGMLMFGWSTALIVALIGQGWGAAAQDDGPPPSR